MNKSKNKKNMKQVVENRIAFLKGVIYLSFTMLILGVGYVIIFQNTYYSRLLEKMTSNVYEYSSVPRGRIYDRNHRLLVDNQEVASIVYLKPEKVTEGEELRLSLQLAEFLEVDISRVTTRMLKDYWLVENYLASNKLITSEEWEKYENRKLNSNDIYYLKLDRIPSQELEQYDLLQKESAYLYYLMNNGYSYEEKIVKKGNVTDLEIAMISEHLKELPGIRVVYDWERVYLYGDTFRSILGNISKISREDKDYYLAKGYALNDIVGVSYIEKQYEDILRGIKKTYTIENDEMITLSEGKRGNDIVLTIDIELQKAIEQILIEEIKKTKEEAATSLFNHAYVVIQDPNSGEILAMAGKQVLKRNGEYQVYDVTPGILTNPLTPGSVVKGASMLVGYQEQAIKIGEVQVDECIKLYSKPKKCSWTRLGRIDDITALAQSSNVYQFKTAMKVAGFPYTYNAKFTNTEEAFGKYRSIFQQLGLGVKTGIDLPIDGVGNIGNKTDPDLFLNYVIGQYDTYTTMQLSQYISTIAARGVRYRPHLLKAVYKSDGKEELGSLLYQVDKEILGQLKVDSTYLERVQLGLREVMVIGLGRGYMGDAFQPAGKTGTSESFLDTNGDGIVDTPTLTNAFVGYYPFDQPKMSIAITFPNLVSSSDSNRRSYANKRITKMISNKFFELYG